MTYDGDITLPSPRHGRAVKWHTRTNTNDGALVTGIIASDEYELGRLPQMSGWAIDIGAHIGIVALALAADHPDLKVIAVEPVPDNVEGLRMNVEANGLGDRVTVIEAAADAPGAKRSDLYWDYSWAEGADKAYVDDSRYIANIFGPLGSDGKRHRVKSISLDTLMKDIDEVVFLKIDCEGCEWQFLRSKRVKDVKYIAGEFHGVGTGSMERLGELLGATHNLHHRSGGDDVGIFYAVRR